MVAMTTHAVDVADKWRAGTDNLLLNCAELKSGQKVLVVNEPAQWAERDAIEYIEERARELGGIVQSVWTGRPTSPEAIPPDLAHSIRDADLTIFNHQVGAMLRFRPIDGKGVRVLNYATTGRLLEAEFCRIPYALWTKASKLIGQELRQAKQWRITCPLGTDLAGTVPTSERERKGGNADGFALRTFPIGTHPPTSCMNASGKIAVRWLTSSGIFDIGSQGVRLDGVVHIELQCGHVTNFSGQTGAVRQARDFLLSVGEKLGKDGLVVNSWHGGVNPQVFSPWHDTDSLEAWMRLATNNPRMVHFHAVGEPIPGEISVPIIDPTVTIDGARLWEGGRFTPLDTMPFQAIAAEWQGGTRAFERNSAIGV
jgi:hypothetical protein